MSFLHRTGHGKPTGEAVSEGWIIKLYTDMEIDDSGAPIGPGCVLQILLNVPYDIVAKLSEYLSTSFCRMRIPSASN